MTRAYLAFTFLCVVFGTTFGAIKVGLAEGWPPLLSAGLRFTVAGLLVLAVAYLRGDVRALRRADVAGVAAIGLTVTALTFGVVYTAETVLPSGLAALLAATSPLFAVLIAVAERRRRLEPIALTGIVCATAGVALVAGVGRIAGNAALFAALAIVVSEIGYVWGLGRARAVSVRVPMLQLAGLQQVIGGGVLLALALIFERRGPTHASVSGVAALLYLTFVASAGAHTVSLWLAARTNATFASSWTYIAPFIALAVGAAALREPLTLVAWIGGSLVIAGALLLNRDVRVPAPVDASAYQTALGAARFNDDRAIMSVACSAVNGREK